MAKYPYVVAQVGTGPRKYAIMSDGSRLSWDSLSHYGYKAKGGRPPESAPTVSPNAGAALAKAHPGSGGSGGYAPSAGDNPLENRTTMPTGGFFDNATPTTRPKGKQTPADTLATQKFLKNKGYNIGVDGVWGPQTQSAALNWRNTRNPTVWNRSVNATPSTRPTFTAPKSGGGGASPNRPPDVGAGAPTPSAPGKPGPTLMDQLMAMLGKVPNASQIPMAWAKQGGGGIPLSDIPDITGDLIDPKQAQAQMDAQYAPLIQEQQNRLGVVPYDAAQHLNDIRTWFDQIKGSVNQASSDVGNITDQTAGAMGADAGAIASSLGGDANAGGRSISVEGANQTDVLNQIGGIEQQYLGQMGPILSGQAQAAASNETARQQGFARDFQNKILEIQAQKAADSNDKMLQIAQYNHGLQQERFQNIMGVKQYNQGLSQQQLQNMLGITQANQGSTQQNFSNRLAMAGFGLSANQLGLTAADTASTINARDQGTTRANIQTAAQIAANRRAASIASQNTALKTNQGAQTAQLSGLMAAGQSVGTLVPDANGKPQPWSGIIPKGKVQMAVKAARGAVTGLPPAVQKRVMRAILSTFKNEKGQPLLTMNQIKAWGY